MFLAATATAAANTPGGSNNRNSASNACRASEQFRAKDRDTYFCSTNSKDGAAAATTAAC